MTLQIREQTMANSGRIRVTVLTICLFFWNLTSALGQDEVSLFSIDSLLNVHISTAAKYEQKVSEAPASVSVITAEEIERFGFRTLDELLTSVCGIYSRYDRDYSYIGLRGFDLPSSYNNKMVLLLNGNTMNEGYYGSAALGTDLAFNLDIVERVEIVRGPGSALYGAGAVLGVVNIITKSAKTVDGARIKAETGSYGDKGLSLVYGREYENGLKALFHYQVKDIDGRNIYFREYDNPETNSGVAEQLDWQRSYGVLATVEYKDFSVLAGRTSRKQGIPTGSYGMQFNNSRARDTDRYSFLEIKYKKQITYDKNISFRGYLNKYQYAGTNPNEENDSYDSSEALGVGGEIQFNWEFNWGNRLFLGTEFKDYSRALYREWDDERLVFQNNTPYQIFSLYLQDDYQLRENLALTLGLRHDHYSLSEGSTTPRAAIVYNPARSTTLKLLFGKSFRSPNPYELYYQSEYEAKSNPLLTPEKLFSEEIIWEQQLKGNMLLSASFYSFEMKNLINQELDSSDGLLQFRNAGKVRGRGLEIELRGSAAGNFNGYINYSYQKTKNLMTGERLANSPAQALKAGLVVPLARCLYSGVEVQYYTRRRTVFGSTTESFVLTNVNISSRKFIDHLKFSLLIRNIFNTLYATPGGFEHIQKEIIQDRRNFTARIEYQF
jgi:outer membrane receptor for ferrienterochelin and colicins